MKREFLKKAVAYFAK